MSIVGQRIVKTICSSYCLFDERYISEDSHIVAIPISLFNTILKKKNNDSPIFVKIVNPRDRTKFLHFGRIEPSINSENCRHDMCLMPYWALQKIGIDNIEAVVNIFYVDYTTVEHASLIKIKANKSDYVKWDNVKELIEEKLSSFNCINLHDTIIIQDVTFTITQIKNKDGNDILYTSTFNDEINLEFELPEDLEEQERKKAEQKERVLQRAKCEEKEEVIVQHTKFMTFETLNNPKKSTVFESEGLKLSNSTTILSKEEIRRQRLNALNKN